MKPTLKFLLWSVFALLITSESTLAQWDSYTVTPRSRVFGGGYQVQGSDGSYGTITPRHQVFGGGYEIRGSDGSYGTVTPRSQILGGGVSVNVWRGMDSDSVLFADPSMAKQFPEDEWIAAAESRDVLAMAEIAWLLKGVEAIQGKVDAKTTSEDMFKAAAEVAVEQDNASALARIIALCPACKSYENELKANAAERGVVKIVTMPQIVEAPITPFDPAQSGAFERDVNSLSRQLKPWQTPALTPDLLRFGFRGMSTPDAENVASMANRGRQTGNPAMLAQAAVSLAALKPDTEYSFLSPKRMIDEATGFALFLGDVKALTQIKHIYESDVFGLPDTGKAQMISNELKAMGTSRGEPESPVEGTKRLIKIQYQWVPPPLAPATAPADIP